MLALLLSLSRGPAALTLIFVLEPPSQVERSVPSFVFTQPTLIDSREPDHEEQSATKGDRATDIGKPTIDTRNVVGTFVTDREQLLASPSSVTNDTCPNSAVPASPKTTSFFFTIAGGGTRSPPRPGGAVITELASDADLTDPDATFCRNEINRGVQKDDEDDGGDDTERHGEVRDENDPSSKNSSTNAHTMPLISPPSNGEAVPTERPVSTSYSSRDRPDRRRFHPEVDVSTFSRDHSPAPVLRPRPSRRQPLMRAAPAQPRLLRVERIATTGEQRHTRRDVIVDEEEEEHELPSRRGLHDAGGRGRSAKSQKGEPTTAAMPISRLVLELKRALARDPTAYYTVKGVLAEHIDDARSNVRQRDPCRSFKSEEEESFEKASKSKPDPSAFRAPPPSPGPRVRAPPSDDDERLTPRRYRSSFRNARPDPPRPPRTTKIDSKPPPPRWPNKSFSLTQTDSDSDSGCEAYTFPRRQDRQPRPSSARVPPPPAPRRHQEDQVPGPRGSNARHVESIPVATKDQTKPVAPVYPTRLGSPRSVHAIRLATSTATVPPSSRRPPVPPPFVSKVPQLGGSPPMYKRLKLVRPTSDDRAAAVGVRTRRDGGKSERRPLASTAAAVKVTALGNRRELIGGPQYSSTRGAPRFGGRQSPRSARHEPVPSAVSAIEVIASLRNDCDVDMRRLVTRDDLVTRAGSKLVEARGSKVGETQEDDDTNKHESRGIVLIGGGRGGGSKKRKAENEEGSRRGGLGRAGRGGKSERESSISFDFDDFF